MMLAANDLTKLYGMRPVLRNVSLNIGQGEYIAVLGPNGAGKTTLLRVLATLVRPDSGSLVIGGIDALQQPARSRALIGMVSHQPLVYPDLSAAENLEFYAQLYGVPEESELNLAGGQAPRTALKSIVEEALRRVDLLSRARDPVRTFSRGMVQRLAIARAILHNPPLLLLDEPYTGLDQVSARSLSALLRDLAIVGRAVIMTTHEFGRGLDTVTRAILIKSGRISADVSEGITPDRISRLFG
jgi:heme exporter protein A